MSGTNIEVAAGEATGAKDHNHDYEVSVQFLDELTSKCDEIQGKVLIDILTQNAETEYLKRHGTSDGQRKVIPATKVDMEMRLDLLTSVTPFIRRRIEGEEPDRGKALSLFVTRRETITPGGLLARAALNSILKNPRFYRDNPYPYNTNTSPIEAIHCSDHFQSIYTQLLCGIYQRNDVTRVKTIFGSSLVWGIHFLKTNYTDLCHDISSGSLNPKITDPCLRALMVETFMKHPQPELAKFIENVCVEENWEGIFQKIWPNIKYLEAIVTGSMSQYIPMLDYYSGGLPLVSIKYSSSECDLGFNLNPMCDPCDISYTIMPNMAYYEFIPLNSEDCDDSSHRLELIDMANVEVGREYELVVTTFSGLYRYRMGDVLCPTGFYNSTPQFKFVRRKNVVLSIENDSTTESELHKAIEMASNVLQPYDTIILDYTSNACTKTIPGHYVIYLELMTKNRANVVGPDILEECCEVMDEALGFIYRLRRADRYIGPIEIRVVSNGTFEKLRDDAISQGASFTQFKMPRCVKLLHILELLDSRVVSTHFTSSVPHCRP
ncbi:hypothetical protein KSS87_001547 [Heliosperma pusillum]|nr:hypothetical protein KSS87_001547 [Heliosperma pusillum]